MREVMVKIQRVKPIGLLFYFTVFIQLSVPGFSVSKIQAADESWRIYDDRQVTVIQITVDPEDLTWMYRSENLDSDSQHVAQVHFRNGWIDESIDSVGFRLRGNTSRQSAKKSFRLDFNKFMSGREFYDIETLNLNGEHNDPSIIRAKLCWDLFGKIGVIASRAAHAAVYINGEYYGLYISVEDIDDQFLKNHFTDDSGNLWKCLYPADLTLQGSNPADPKNYQPYAGDDRPYELITNEETNDFSQLARLIYIINTTPDELFADSLENVLCVADVLKIFAIDILTGSWDDYWSLMNNYYLYHVPQENRFHWIPYDYDNSFGIDWFNVDWARANPYNFPKVNNGYRPLAERLMNNAQYRNLYTRFLQFYRNYVYLLPLWEDRLDSIKEQITPYAESDYYRTLDYGFTVADFHNSYTDGHYQNQHVKRGLREFVELRSDALPAQLNWVESAPVVYDLKWTAEFPGAGDSIHVTSAVFSHAGIKEVNILYKPGNLDVIYRYPMKFDPVQGSYRTEDVDRWVGVIAPMQEHTYAYFSVEALDINGRSMQYPRAKDVFLQTQQDVASHLHINELLAKNDHSITDEAGQHEDWIEIYNSGSTDADLTGMYLTDSPLNLKRWRFPEGVMIGAGQHLMVWCDDDENQPGIHTNFKLAVEGEYIALTAPDGVSIIDSISFGGQQPDIAFGRYPDGADNWTVMTPSPGMSNGTTDIESINPPVQFMLNAYPNPFNQSVTLHYQLPAAGKVDIVIFNTAGQSVWSYSNDMQPAGRHILRWNGLSHSHTALASGVYICRFVSSGSRGTVKLVLLR